MAALVRRHGILAVLMSLCEITLIVDRSRESLAVTEHHLHYSIPMLRGVAIPIEPRADEALAPTEQTESIPDTGGASVTRADGASVPTVIHPTNYPC